MDVVIGAGVVGLACAAALARRGREVIILEQHGRVGQETSSRNSGVIHAGLYYPTGSLKALTCIEGRRLLYERCRSLGIPHQRTGKLVVAVEPSEVLRLEKLLARGRANGAGDLAIVDGAELKRLEPRVRAMGALWSPETGIVDAHGLVKSYEHEAESHGATLVLHARVVAVERAGGGWKVSTVTDGGEAYALEAACVVNAAGLASDKIAALAGLDIDALGWRLRPCKGDYFALSASRGRVTNHLVYPIPSGGGLGVHVTFDLAGRFRLGPDAEYVGAPFYSVDDAKAERFSRAARRYLPEIQAADLSPDYAGVRPKLQGPGEPFRDFVIEESSARGAPRLVNLIGIESPGLTAAGAIAERVSALVD